MHLIQPFEGLRVPIDHVVYDVSSLSNPLLDAYGHVVGTNEIIVFEHYDKHYMIVPKDAIVSI